MVNTASIISAGTWGASLTDGQFEAIAKVTDAVRPGVTCAYFNFINRVAEGLGVDHEAWMEDLAPLGPCAW